MGTKSYQKQPMFSKAGYWALLGNKKLGVSLPYNSFLSVFLLVCVFIFGKSFVRMGKFTAIFTTQ